MKPLGIRSKPFTYNDLWLPMDKLRGNYRCLAPRAKGRVTRERAKGPARAVGRAVGRAVAKGANRCGGDAVGPPVTVRKSFLSHCYIPANVSAPSPPKSDHSNLPFLGAANLIK